MGNQPRDILAEIRNLADSLPSRIPTTLRVGPGVLDVLRIAAGPAPDHGPLPLDVTVVADAAYAAGEWRLFDQWDEALHEGEVEALRGMAADMRVVTSPYLPPGVIAMAISPSDLHPDDPDYPPLGVHAVVLREGDTRA